MLDSVTSTINLTPAELSVWLAHHLYTDPSVLNAPITVEIPCGVDARAFAEAFQTLVNSADVLRSVFRDLDGVPTRIVHARVAAPVKIEDFRTSAAPEADARRWVVERSAIPLDIRREVFDCALLRLGDQKYVWYLNQHHIVTDGWSMQLAVDYMADLYARRIARALPSQITLPQFEDYAFAARNVPADPGVDAERRSRNVTAPRLYGRAGAPVGAKAFRVHHRLRPEMSRNIAALITRFSSRERLGGREMLALLVACMAAFEYRVSGETQLAISVPFHNRTSPFLGTLGLFATVRSVVLTLSPRMTFQELLGQSRAEIDKVLHHSTTGETDRAKRVTSHAMVNMLAFRQTSFAGVPVQPARVFTGHLDEYVGLEAAGWDARGIPLDFDFRGDLFTPAQAHRAVQHFERIVDLCTDSPDASIQDGELVTPTERRQLEFWSHPTARPLPNGSFLDLIADVAGRAPHRVAIRDQSQSLTYEGLMVAATILAANLAEAGVSRNIPVLMALERSTDALVAMLAVLIAGGAFVPVDPNWPIDRLAFIAQDANLRHAIVFDRQRSKMSTALGPRVSLITPQTRRTSADARTSTPPRDPERTAYIIYTSGSTGRPKGVAVSDRSLLNHLIATATMFRLDADDNMLQFHPLTFDASVEEILPAWVAGATLVLRPTDISGDLERFTAFIASERITAVNLPTAFWHAWVHTMARVHQTVPSSLRLVIVAGEQPSAGVLADWRTLLLGPVRWLNIYGPTEATITSTVFEPAADPVAEPIAMGRPIDNVSAWVLDDLMQLMPVGAPGELYIGGAGVAQGYVNRPELTTARFVDDPFDSGGRLYRTGDLVRYRDDGNLEYRGRLDDQVKIRGYRIELGEVEQALHQHPAVVQAAVLARRVPDLYDDLVAFVVLKGDAAPDLRAFLKRTLPDYMVPTIITPVPKVPLTPHGKVDRRALLDMTTVEEALEIRTPRTVPLCDPIQADLIASWRRLLDAPDIGPQDSFLARGGHSLLAARAIEDIADRFGHRLPLSVMFPDTTIEQLADHIRHRAAADRRGALTSLNTDRGAPRLVFFHGDYTSGGLYASRLARLLGDMPIAVVHPHGSDEPSVPPTVEEMARQHLPEILKACPSGPYVLAGYCNGALEALETARLLTLRGHRIDGVLLIDAALPMVRYRSMARLAHWYARRRYADVAAARDSFLRWRDRVDTVADLLSMRRNARFPTVARKMQFVIDTLRRRAARTNDGQILEDGSHREDPARSGAGREAVWTAYSRAIDAYLPQPYRGRVVVLASTALLQSTGDREWRKVAKELTVVSVPGSHLACVTEHLPTVARVLSDLVATGSSAERRCDLAIPRESSLARVSRRLSHVASDGGSSGDRATDGDQTGGGAYSDLLSQQARRPHCGPKEGS